MGAWATLDDLHVNALERVYSRTVLAALNWFVVCDCHDGCRVKRGFSASKIGRGRTKASGSGGSGCTKGDGRNVGGYLPRGEYLAAATIVELVEFSVHDNNLLAAVSAAWADTISPLYFVVRVLAPGACSKFMFFCGIR